MGRQNVYKEAGEDEERQWRDGGTELGVERMSSHETQTK